MDDTFKLRRTLSHQLVDLWRETFGKEWVKVMGSDPFYVDPPLTTEVEIREYLINLSPAKLDSLIMSSELNIEFLNG